MTHTAGSVDDLERCLANADWEGFVGQLRSLENLEERRRLQEGLGKRHPKQIDLVQRLRAWPAGDSGRAATHLLPALLHAALTIPQLLELLQFAVSAGANVRYRVIEVLRNALSAPSAAWHDIAAAVSTDASLAPALDVWLTAFVQARPADAAAYAIELPTGTSSERELLARFLVLLRPFLASITPILLPHAGRLLSAVLLDAPRDGLHFSVLWSAVRTLAHVHAPAMEALMEASRAGQTPALVALANWLPGLSEPYRFSRRLLHLRKRSHEKVKEVFPRGHRARRANGRREPAAARVAVGRHCFDRRQDRLHGGDAAALGAAA